MNLLFNSNYNKALRTIIYFLLLTFYFLIQACSNPTSNPNSTAPEIIYPANNSTIHLYVSDTISVIVSGRPAHFSCYFLQIDTNSDFSTYAHIREGICSDRDRITILYLNDYFIDTTRFNYWLRVRSVDSSNNISPFSDVNVLHVIH